MEIHMRSTNGSIEYRVKGEVGNRRLDAVDIKSAIPLQLQSIPLRRRPIPELLAHLGLADCDFSWRWDNSLGMNIAIEIEDSQICIVDSNPRILQEAMR